MTPANSQNVSIDLLDAAVSYPISTVHGPARTRRFEIPLSARSLLVFVFLVLIFTVSARQIIDPDFWWHLRTGQHLLATRTIPHTDLFSAVFAGKDWITHEWLSEVFIYSVYRTMGYGGLIVSFALLITAGFAVAYRRLADLPQDE